MLTSWDFGFRRDLAHFFVNQDIFYTQREHRGCDFPDQQQDFLLTTHGERWACPGKQ